LFLSIKIIGTSKIDSIYFLIKLFFAKKPLKRGFYKAQKLLGIEKVEEIAVAGDQLFTDVLGANRVGMISILVEPVDKRDLWHTKIKRPVEEIFIRKYVKKTEGK
jgi:HAD superfamily phosphatase (TIGR01668 family)